MLKKTRIKTVSLVCLSLVICLCTASLMGAADSSDDYLHANPEDVQAWREMRFGLFIHWGR